MKHPTPELLLPDPEQPTKLLVGGVWRTASDTFTSYNPADGAALQLVGQATTDDVNDAVTAATAAMRSTGWHRLPKPRLAEMLWRTGELIERHADELAMLETLDNGQPIGVARHANVTGAAEHFRYFAGWATKLDGRLGVTGNPDVQLQTRREPVGVCALITPWNFPLMMAAWKLAPALACGNAVILKPAEQTPLTSIRLGELLIEAGFPPGVVSVLPGGPQVGAALVDHPGIDKISFTGSTEVGRAIGVRAAARSARVTLELGGKAPMIVAADADLGRAVETAVQGAMFNSGQVCAAYARIYVDESRREEFTERAARLAASLRIGKGLDPQTEVGPLVTGEHRAKVEAAVASGVSDGAQVVTGGGRPGGVLGNGFFYQPTVLAGARDEMSVVREEIFGPVVPVLGYGDLDEAIDRANNTEYGLAACVYSHDVRVVNRVAEAVRAGAVFVNMLHVPDPSGPWGGFKSSGIGREMGPDALEAYTETKGVFVDMSQ